MVRIKFRLFFLLLPASCLWAQSWSGIISSSRALDWSTAGVVNGIPNRTIQCGPTIAAYSGPADAINNAIAVCGTGQYVQLGAGTFNLSTGITFNVNSPASSVTLRGMGANQTFLVFSGSNFCMGYSALVCLAGGPGGVNSEQNVCDWTAGYGQVATTITLSNCGTTTPAVGAIGNIKIGSLLILDQVDEASDTGQIWNCLVSGICAGEGTGFLARSDGPTVGGVASRSQQQVVRVTNCVNTAGACTSGTNITVSPGLYMPNWTSAQKPQAFFATTYLRSSGVENLSIDTGGASLAEHNVTVVNCDQCWLKGIRSLYGPRSHVMLAETSHSSVVDSYFYQDLGHNTQSYGLEMAAASDSLIQNNIWQQITDATPTCNGGCEGNVIAYNFAIDSQYAAPGWFQSSYYLHASGDAFNLFEGNVGTGFNADNIHGTHHFATLYRNHLQGWQLKCDVGADACTFQTTAINLASGSRYFNLIGNVLGTPGYHNQYACMATSAPSCANAATSIFWMGFTGNGGTSNANITGYCTTPACSTRSDYDPLTGSYALRWGNWDSVTKAARWCGNSSDIGWSTTCGNISEIPTTVSPYGNNIPSIGDTGAGQSALPPSFFLGAKPSWWGALPWPGIGPDVTGGNIGQCTTGTFAQVVTINGAMCAGGLFSANAYAGHAYASPAMSCALNVMNMPVDGSGSGLNFNAASCYSAAPVPPNPPALLSTSAH